MRFSGVDCLAHRVVISPSATTNNTAMMCSLEPAQKFLLGNRYEFMMFQKVKVRKILIGN
jgi:hypothetical protein